MKPRKPLPRSTRFAAALAAFVSVPLAQGQQNPFGQLGEAIKQKAAERTISALLNNNLPLKLDANAVYPTVAAPPGGPFVPQPLTLTAADLDRPLPPGDYTLNVLAFCTEYSVHRPGAGVAYRLGPLQGKAASAIGDLLWRGTLEKNIPPQQLQAVSWAIQSGLRYDQMPRTYQSVIDNVIPDHRNELNGDFFQSLEDTYNSLAKGTRLPPLQQMLAGMGKSGQLALSADRQRQALLQQNTKDQIREQTLFAGQETGVYTPVRAEQGPWTEKIPGVAYVRFVIVGGNLARNNIMQIRILPARGQRAGYQRPHVMYAGFNVRPALAAFTAAPLAAGQTEMVTAANLASLIAGIGCPVGQGAQCEIPVPVTNPAPTPPPCVSPCAGHIKTVQGQVQVTRGNSTFTLNAGDPINIGDQIQTGDNSRAELDFLDDTNFILGGKTRITIDNYVYDPTQHSSAAYRFLEGTFRYVSSKLAKPKDHDSSIQTGYGTIGIRGTEFVASEDATGQDEIDLIRGQLDITPKARTQATMYTGPVKILLNNNSSSASPLSQSEYDAIQARLSFAQPSVPVL